MKFSTLIRKAFEAGWRHSSYDPTILIRPVPFKTRPTQFTCVFRANDSASEHISQINLQHCGSNSRVWVNLSV